MEPPPGSGDFQIPLIDFSDYSLKVKEKDTSIGRLQTLASKICEAFQTSGFLYLQNFGIDLKEVSVLQDMALRFFQQPTDVKNQYKRVYCHGWMAMEEQMSDSEKPGDLKESFDVIPGTDPKFWPDAVIPGFESSSMDIFCKCSELANRLLYLIGLGLKLEKPSMFCDSHNPLKKPSHTALRLAYYPIVDPDTVKAGQLRCGEHSDYGAISLLFQDDVGGLEVKNTRGDFMSATPIEDTILVNIGDMMQRWTSDRLISTRHRVVFPTSEKGQTKPRMSAIMFVQPDDDCPIECVDGSNKYKPMSSLEYLQLRLRETYTNFE